MQAIAGALSQVENVAISWYEQEQKIKREEKLSRAEIDLDNELEILKNQQRDRDPMQVIDGDPSQDELSFGELARRKLDEIAAKIDDGRVRKAFLSGARQTLNTKRISVNQDARNRLIDKRAATEFQKGAMLEELAVTGNGAERARAMLQLFGGNDSSGNAVVPHYATMAASGLITNVKAQEKTLSARKDVLKRQRQHDAAVLEINTDKRVLIAGDTKEPVEVRLAALKNGAEAINQALNAGIIDEAKAMDMMRKATDDTARSIGLKLMEASSDASGVALQIFSGNVSDPVMAELLSTMDPSDKQKLISDFFRNGLNVDTRRRQQEEANEKAADKENKNIYEAIINVDTENETAVAVAIEDHNTLLSRNWYTDTQRKAVEAVLGIKRGKDAGDQTKTSQEALRVLNQADHNNVLTMGLVDEYAGQLSNSDYNEFAKRVIAEGKEGRTAAKNLISSKLRYNEFKDSNNALGDAADMMFQQSMFALDDWLNTPRDQGGGQGATYQEVLSKAREINAANDADYVNLMKDAFVQYLDGLKIAFPNVPVDADDPMGGVIKWLSTQNINDPLIKGIANTVRSYKKLGVK